MHFVDEHLAVFRESAPGRWRSSMTLENWLGLACISLHQVPKWYHSRILSRDDLGFLGSAPAALNTFEICACVFAWGGMKPHHAKALFGCSDKRWLTVADNFRNANFDSFEAYDRFNKLTREGAMPGVGPAYFSKLLFFLPIEDSKRGLIMDQWTGRSVNLLTGVPVVKLTSQYLVDKQCSVDRYCQFVGVVSELSKLLHGDSTHANVALTELCLFSQGGRPNELLPWRRHVKENAGKTPRR